MTYFRSRFLLAGASLAALATPAFAQNAIDDIDVDSVVVAGAEAAVQVAAANTAPEVERVTVTARRREEDLQRVPIAISVVSGELLDNTATVNPQYLAQLVPTLYYNSANPRNTAITIRGLGSNTLSISAA